jgi:hypothetical protein
MKKYYIGNDNLVLWIFVGLLLLVVGWQFAEIQRIRNTVGDIRSIVADVQMNLEVKNADK